MDLRSKNVRSGPTRSSDRTVASELSGNAVGFVSGVEEERRPGRRSGHGFAPPKRPDYVRFTGRDGACRELPSRSSPRSGGVSVAQSEVGDAWQEEIDLPPE